MSFPFGLFGPPNFFVLFGLGIPNLPINTDYKAILSANEQEITVGQSVILDARQSIGAGGNPPDVYYWFINSLPIGSKAGQLGVESLETDDSRVLFTPDITGIYEIGLIVGDLFYLSEPTYSLIYVKIMVVPYGKGLVPDVSFIWNYLGDFWQQFRDREFFSTMWSSFTQIAGARLLSLYQTNFNKSIDTIQELFQKRWVNFTPIIPLTPNDCSVILGDDYVGTNANAGKLTTQVLSDNYIDSLYILQSSLDFVTTPYGKPIGKRFIHFDLSNYILYQSLNAGFTFPLQPPNTYSVALTKEKEILRDGASHYVRLSNRLISQTIDFEKEGVKYGDSLRFKISFLTDGVSNGRETFLDTFIVGAKEKSVGFTYSAVQDGVADTGISSTDIVRMFNELLIPGASLSGTNVVYGANSPAEFVHNGLSSIAFKRKWYEIELSETLVDLGYYNSQLITLKVEPYYIARKKSIRLSDQVFSIPNLQEYIQQPIISTENGQKYIVANDIKTEISKDPYFLFENLDYITSNQFLPVHVNTFSTEVVEVLFGDLIDRSLEQGDLLEINGVDYIIARVIDKTHLRVTNPIPFTVSARKALIKRRLEGYYIRFCDGVISSAPEKGLWCEEVFLDNNKTVEDNFGSIVKITREQIQNQSFDINYKAAVSGLLYGLAKGPTIYNLKLGAQILLGLPFAYTKGRIIEIKPVYSVRPDYSPEYGRIIIEEIDSIGKPTGLVNIYFYPRGPQIFVMGRWEPTDPGFTGLAINPVTNKEYALGDIVERFAPLSKGVEIVDYLIDPAYVSLASPSIEALLQKYHTFFLRINLDVVGVNFALIIQYLLQMKPSYTVLKTFAQKKFTDVELVTDDLTLQANPLLFDVEGLSLPTANIVNSYLDSQYIFNVSGEMYSRYIKGADLNSTGVVSVTSAAGGFINARMNESHDTPFIRAGDLVTIYNGINAGDYLVTAVNSDTSLNLDSATLTAQNQKFSVYRKIKNPIFTGSATFNIATTTVTVPSGDLSAGVAVGDKIFFYMASPSRIYTISAISGTTITVSSPFIEASGTYSFVIFRDGVLTNTLLQTTSTPFSANLVAGNPWISLLNNLNEMTPQKGDILNVDSYPPFDIYDWDEINRAVYVIPTPTANDTQNAGINRPYKPSGFPSDLQTTSDAIKLLISPDTSLCTTGAGTRIVTFSVGTDLGVWNIKPGDFFKATIGPDSTIDVGYGLGVYPIAEVNSIVQITLTRQLISTQNNVDYQLIRLKNIN